jgi:hypothetical protein
MHFHHGPTNHLDRRGALPLLLRLRHWQMSCRVSSCATMTPQSPESKIPCRLRSPGVHANKASIMAGRAAKMSGGPGAPRQSRTIESSWARLQGGTNQVGHGCWTTVAARDIDGLATNPMLCLLIVSCGGEPAVSYHYVQWKYAYGLGHTTLHDFDVWVGASAEYIYSDNNIRQVPESTYCNNLGRGRIPLYLVLYSCDTAQWHPPRHYPEVGWKLLFASATSCDPGSYTPVGLLVDTKCHRRL